MCFWHLEAKHFESHLLLVTSLQVATRWHSALHSHTCSTFEQGKILLTSTSCSASCCRSLWAQANSSDSGVRDGQEPVGVLRQ